MTLREFREVLGAGEPKAICAAVRGCREVLGDVGVDRDAYGELLVGLVGHATGEVRQAVAELCDHLSDAHVDAIVERLSGDADRYVRNAATAAAARRASKKRARGRAAREEKKIEGALGAIEAKDGKGARRRVDAAVRRGVEQFIRRLEHELTKTDGTAIRALAALRSELEKPDASVALMRRSVSTLEEQGDFRRAILERARQYATEIKPVFAARAMAGIVDEARQQLVDRLRERASRVAFEVDIDAELVAEVDKHALLQALQNVLQNAVEAYPAERATWPLRVSARTKRANSLVELRVSDEGGGITDEERARMFVPFGSTKPGGSGVGMLIVRTMVEEVHGGELAIESAPGVGTTVTMILPMQQRGAR